MNWDWLAAHLEALLKIHDPNFYQHHGVDLTSPGAGNTTISQSLVKFYYFEDFKPGLLNKIKQTLIARFAFDNLTPKDSILTLFINEVYLGNFNGYEIKGYENAARAYYHKPFRELSEDEFLAITAMIRSPLTFHCIENPQKNAERVLRIKRMLAGSYIPQAHQDWEYDR